MRYLSVCSGIEAATVSWEPLGWTPAAFSEIDKFPRAVLAHHYPAVPLHGDFTTIKGDEYGPVDVLVGGTPCQDFSVAGLRAGIAGERGNLTLDFLRLAARSKPRWIVWENVPGVLSSDDGRALGAFLGGLAELGYGFAYRVLDAQYFGLAQRRARVFVVGHLGDWRRAAAVLFEPESLRRDTPPSRKAGERIANSLVERPDRGGGNSEGQRTDFDCDGGLIHCADVAATLNSHFGDKPGLEDQHINGSGSLFVAHAFNWQSGGDARGLEPKETTSALSCEQTPAIAFTAKDYGQDAGHISPTLRGGAHVNGSSEWRRHACGGRGPAGGGNQGGDYIQHGMAVRRLTPRECERLQGFPDDYTLVPWRKGLAPDGPRYKALGNSMAVPVMRWIGERIQMVEKMK